MKIRNSIALVTGANRGLGSAFVQALLDAGAKKVYAAARDPRSIKIIPGVEPLQIDVTNTRDVAAAAHIATDVNLVINNAGIFRPTPLLAATDADLRAEMDTNYFGPLAVSRAFAPLLARNGGGALVNVLSVLSWVNLPGTALYSASKAAAWSLTNALREELRTQGTHVVGLHVGFMDTDMAKDVQSQKSNPLDVARQVLAALENGSPEVLADAVSRQVKAGLSAALPVHVAA
jgi:NAD(P)-dependent dehydrogenase (short-subunit alcohol dehydrogenase family)